MPWWSGSSYGRCPGPNLSQVLPERELVTNNFYLKSYWFSLVNPLDSSPSQIEKIGGDLKDHKMFWFLLWK